MSQDFKAFTMSANGIINVLFTRIGISSSSFIQRTYEYGSALITGIALWDTGANRSVISSKLVNNLSLEPVAMMPASGVHKQETCKVYLIDVHLPNMITVKDVKVIEVKNIPNADVLIGMDIITIGDFSITNANKKTVFSFRFPSDFKHIDYAQKAKEIREKKERRQKNKQRAKKRKL